MTYYSRKFRNKIKPLFCSTIILELLKNWYIFVYIYIYLNKLFKHEKTLLFLF